MVKAERMRRLGSKQLPPSMQTTITDLAGGGFDSEWVELEGIVRSCVNAPIGPTGFDVPSTATDLANPYFGPDALQVRIACAGSIPRAAGV
jgi:hypothetical protein